MSKFKYLGGMVLGASLLASPLASAEVTPIGALTTSQSILVKFLSATASINYALFFRTGTSYTEAASGNVSAASIGPFDIPPASIAQVTFGKANLSGGDYGWLKFSPQGGNTVAFNWTGNDINVSEVPEPGVYALIALGIAGIALTRSRQRKAQLPQQFAV